VRPAVFLDRDGTIIVDKSYLGDPDGVVLERGAVSGLRTMAGLGYELVVVSNQSGIGRGLITREAVDCVNRRVTDELRREGVSIAGWYICPHSPELGCNCRKPRPALIEQAASDMALDVAGSFIIGDKKSDLMLAYAVGATGILVMTGHGAMTADWARESGFCVCAGLYEVARCIRSAHR
jgi:histidinol-phosphate phosphatase family protein